MQALEEDETAIYADASFRKGKAGVGIYQPSVLGSQEYRAFITVGEGPNLTPTHIKLLALESASKHISTIENSNTSGSQIPTKYVMTSDCQAAIQHLSNPKGREGQKSI
jgi:hypothetical protein